MQENRFCVALMLWPSHGQIHWKWCKWYRYMVPISMAGITEFGWNACTQHAMLNFLPSKIASQMNNGCPAKQTHMLHTLIKKPTQHSLYEMFFDMIFVQALDVVSQQCAAFFSFQLLLQPFYNCLVIFPLKHLGKHTGFLTRVYYLHLDAYRGKYTYVYSNQNHNICYGFFDKKPSLFSSSSSQTMPQKLRFILLKLTKLPLSSPPLTC